MRWKVEFHYQIYVSNSEWIKLEYTDGISNSDQLHFVRDPGEFNSRHEDLVLLGIL